MKSLFKLIVMLSEACLASLGTKESLMWLFWREMKVIAVSGELLKNLFKVIFLRI